MENFYGRVRVGSAATIMYKDVGGRCGNRVQKKTTCLLCKERDGAREIRQLLYGK